MSDGIRPDNSSAIPTRIATANKLRSGPRRWIEQGVEFISEEVGDNVVQSPEVPVDAGSACQGIVFTGIVQDVGFCFQRLSQAADTGSQISDANRISVAQSTGRRS
jgi:hypothetical protein